MEETIGRIAIEFITGNDPNLACTRRIDGGGSGRVYELKVTRTQKVFARKVIHLSPLVTREDIEDEAKAIDRLCTDPPGVHVVRIFRHGWLKSATGDKAPLPMYFIDMELGDYSLEDYINNLGEESYLPTANILYIMLQITAGISFIHRSGMIHGDLKPANIILVSGRTWSKNLWKIADFGISTAGPSRGTAHYCAPEILLSEGDVYTNKVDVWAVGLLLYEICTKKRVFQNANAVMQYFWQEDSLPQIPENHPIYTKMEGTHARLSQIEICNAVAPPSSEAELGPWSSGLEHIGYIPSQTFNEYIEWLLQRDQRRRPSIDEIGFYFAVLYLRIGVIGLAEYCYSDLLRPGRIVSSYYDIERSITHRWQFLIKLECQWSHIFSQSKYFGLRDLALRFLRDGVDDPRLNRELLELFPHRFDLCAEFKNLYVYGCSLNPTLSPAELDGILAGGWYSKLRGLLMELHVPPSHISFVTSADELP